MHLAGGLYIGGNRQNRVARRLHQGHEFRIGLEHHRGIRQIGRYAHYRRRRLPVRAAIAHRAVTICFAQQHPAEAIGLFGRGGKKQAVTDGYNLPLLRLGLGKAIVRTVLQLPGPHQVAIQIGFQEE